MGYHFEAPHSNYLTYNLGLYYEAQLANPKHFIQLGIGKSFFNNYALRTLGFKPDEQDPFIQTRLYSVGFVENFGNNWYWRFRVILFDLPKNYYEDLPTDIRMIALPFLGFTLGKTF